MRDPEFGLNFLETYSERLFFATDMVNTEMIFPLGPVSYTHLSSEGSAYKSNSGTDGKGRHGFCMGGSADDTGR